MPDPANKSTPWETTWLAFRQGDLQAFDAIYDHYIDRLYAYGSRLTHHEDILEDSIQELFMYLFTNRRKLAEKVNLEFYLLKALRRTIFHNEKREKRYQKVGGTGSELSLFDFAEEYSGEEDEQTGRARKLNEFLAELSPENREILYLKFYQNLNYREIGEMLGIQPDSAKKQVYRIISRLKETLPEQLMNLLLICFRAYK